MAKEAVGKALADANVSYNEIEQAAVGYVYGKLLDFLDNIEFAHHS